MLTLRTKLALAVLHDIQYKDYQLSTSLILGLFGFCVHN